MRYTTHGGSVSGIYSCDSVFMRRAFAFFPRFHDWALSLSLVSSYISRKPRDNRIWNNLYVGLPWCSENFRAGMLRVRAHCATEEASSLGGKALSSRTPKIDIVCTSGGISSTIRIQGRVWLYRYAGYVIRMTATSKSLFASAMISRWTWDN